MRRKRTRIGRKGNRKEKNLLNELTAKEKLFCLYYHLDRNAREAAVKSGFGNNPRKAIRLLRKKEVSDYIEKLDGERKSCTAEVAAGYRRLAFGCVSDAVTLILDPEISREELLKLDLFNVAEMKRQKGGTVEIKFFDRLKALEKLGEIGESEQIQGSFSLYSAIENSAKAIAEACDD